MDEVRNLIIIGSGPAGYTAAIYLALSGSWGGAVILAVWGALVIGSVDNFLRPKLVGDRTRLHELLIFFSVLGGIQLFGVVGVVLGPVVVAITLALIEIVRQSNQPRGETAQETPPQETVLEKQAEIRQVS